MMRARRLRFGVMLVVALGVVGLALALGMSGGGEQAAATPATVLLANPPTCTATTLGGSRVANAALAADCDALLAMESTLAGTGTLNWAPGLALGSWEGVAVGGTPKRVTQIVIHGGKRMSRLSGTLPTQLGNLGGLTRLDLNGNRLRGPIPTQLGRLTALTYLDLGDNNGLSRSIPPQLGGLTALEGLDLSGNRLTGSIPAQLGSLAALEGLDLSGNRLTGSIPMQLGGLTKLRTLGLSGNTLMGCVPNALWSATTSDLHRLRLESCTVAVVVKGQEVGPGTYRLVRGSSALVFIVPAGLRMRYAYGGSVALCDQGPCNPALLFDVVNHDVSVCVDAVTGNDCSNGARLVKQNDGTWQWTRSANRAGGVSDENSRSHSVSPMVEELIGGFYASIRVEKVP